MMKDKVIPRKRLENETEKNYKLYLREFYFNLNPPKPSTRYDFAYENKLEDSAEVMDGKDGKYVKYLEEFYSDYYRALEQQVNLAFHMPNNNLVDELINESEMDYDVEEPKKESRLKSKFNSAKSYIASKIKRKNKKDKTKKPSKIKNFINNIKEKRSANKEKKIGKFSLIKNYFTNNYNNYKENKKNKEKISLFEKTLKILPKIIMVVAVISGISSIAALLDGATKIGLVGFIASMMALGLGAVTDGYLAEENDETLVVEEKIEELETVEENKNKKQKGKILSLFSRNKKNKTENSECDFDYNFDTTSVEEKQDFEFDTTSVEEKQDFEFDTTSIKEEDFGFDTTSVNDDNYDFDLNNTYGVFENTYRLSKNQIVDGKLEFTKPISRNNINIEEFVEPKRIEQKDVKLLIKK